MEKWFVSKDTTIDSTAWEKLENEYITIKIPKKKCNDLKYILI
jgi:hypothetical protein